LKIGQLRKDDFYLPILRTLEALGGSAANEEMESRIIEEGGFSAADAEATYAKSGQLILPDKISWGRSYLKEAGLINNEKRGLWVITEEGRKALEVGEAAVFEAVAAAMREYAKNYQAKKALAATAGAPAAPTETALEDAAAGQAGGDWSDQMLQKLQSIDPSAFERLCQRLLRENGFIQVQVIGKSGDGGIDGKGVLRVNLVSFQVLFQCKRYQGSVGSGAVRDFRGAMQGRADKGLIITTGSFTPDARREATRDGGAGHRSR
jgi:restriction system protein